MRFPTLLGCGEVVSRTDDANDPVRYIWRCRGSDLNLNLLRWRHLSLLFLPFFYQTKSWNHLWKLIDFCSFILHTAGKRMVYIPSNLPPFHVDFIHRLSAPLANALFIRLVINLFYHSSFNVTPPSRTMPEELWGTRPIMMCICCCFFMRSLLNCLHRKKTC